MNILTRGAAAGLRKKYRESNKHSKGNRLFQKEVSIAKENGDRGATTDASGHTATNTPDLFRTPKLTVAGPGQYRGGGPPGKSLGSC